jgi:hypothetical protein
MKEEIKFPVVGTYYIEGAESYLLGVQEGIPLELKAEPDNPHDQYAIMVFCDGRHVGYVPNRGVTCTNCWSSVKGGSNLCTCGHTWDSFVQGGLAFRLHKTGIMDGKKEYICYLDRLTLDSKVTANAILETD